MSTPTDSLDTRGKTRKLLNKATPTGIKLFWFTVIPIRFQVAQVPKTNKVKVDFSSCDVPYQNQNFPSLIFSL